MNEPADKVALLTGATGGIGRETAAALAREGWTLTLLARDAKKAEQTVAALRALSPHGRVDWLEADLADLASVARAAERFLTTHDRLHLLVNNAGALFARKERTVDGLERSFAVNHVAHFLLTQRLLPLLRASAPARVVNLSSEAHRGARLDLSLPALRGEKGAYVGFLAYSNAKLCNLLFSKELARRLEGTGVTSNAVHPGVVDTGFGKNTPGLFNAMMRLVSPFLLSAERGARTSVHVATAPELAQTSGAYFIRKRPRRPSRAARDPELSRRLWEVSEALVAAVPRA